MEQLSSQQIHEKLVDLSAQIAALAAEENCESTVFTVINDGDKDSHINCKGDSEMICAVVGEVIGNIIFRAGFNVIDFKKCLDMLTDAFYSSYAYESGKDFGNSYEESVKQGVLNMMSELMLGIEPSPSGLLS